VQVRLLKLVIRLGLRRYEVVSSFLSKISRVIYFLIACFLYSYETPLPIPEDVLRAEFLWQSKFFFDGVGRAKRNFPCEMLRLHMYRAYLGAWFSRALLYRKDRQSTVDDRPLAKVK
jgi:hypothetical protein